MSGKYGYVPRTESPYEVLGLDRHGTYNDIEIAKAYRKASLKAHPDKPGGSKKAFDRITASYNMVRTAEHRLRHKKFGQRLQPGAGEALGETIDKLRPLILGMAGGVIYSVSFWKSVPLNVQLIIPIFFVGGGPAVSTRAPVLEALQSSAGGLLVGGGIGSVIYGIAWSATRLFQ